MVKCILIGIVGKNYAMLAMKVILVTLLRTFTFKVDKKVNISEIKLKFDTLLSTEEPLKVIIEKRYTRIIK